MKDQMTPRRGWRGWAGVIVLLALALPLQVSAQQGSAAPQALPPTPVQTARDRITTVVLDSQAREKQTTYRVLLPFTGRAERTYPVLYFLHGAWDSDKVLAERAGTLLGDLARKNGVIIVLPDGDPFGWYADSALIPQNQIETYFFNELMPDVARRFPVNGRQGIAGLSMGGHGAVVLALRHPGIFQSVSAMSGILDLTRHPDNWHLPDVFGPLEGNREIWRSHSAVDLAADHPRLLTGLRFLVTVSTEDAYAITDNREFRDTLAQLGYPLNYHEFPGKHDWTFWRSQMPDHVAFHAGILNFPSPGAPAPNALTPARSPGSNTGGER